MRTTFFLLILTVLVAGSNAKAQERPADKPTSQPATASETAPAMTEEQVVAEIEKCGGTIERDGNAPDGPVVEVTLPPFRGSKAAIGAALGHLKDLKQLKKLYLSSSMVTDTALEQLKGLPQLETLDMGSTPVTDAGLEHLKEWLSTVQTLDLTR